MELGTFGAVFRFAIEMENATIQLYEEAARALPEAAEAFSALARDNQKRSQMLERIRRENVTEMILEPISGLDGSDYLTRPSQAQPMTLAGFLETALVYEESAQRFYSDSVAKAKFLLAEVARVFARLAEANRERQAKLKALK